MVIENPQGAFTGLPRFVVVALADPRFKGQKVTVEVFWELSQMENTPGFGVRPIGGHFQRWWSDAVVGVHKCATAIYLADDGVITHDEWKEGIVTPIRFVDNDNGKSEPWEGSAYNPCGIRWAWHRKVGATGKVYARPILAAFEIKRLRDPDATRARIAAFTGREQILSFHTDGHPIRDINALMADPLAHIPNLGNLAGAQA